VYAVGVRQVLRLPSPSTLVLVTRGPDNVHVGGNLGPDPLVMWIGYIEPAGDPLSTDVPKPGCEFE
jgi:hypothetical protein